MRNKYFRKVTMLVAFAYMVCFLLQGCKHDESEKKKAKEKVEQTAKPKGATICIDPGHGGVDPGKVGVNNALEKDINLAISILLREKLQELGYEVIMTREKDEGLYEEGEKRKKMADLKRRIAMIEEKKPDLVIGIHQNSFTQQSSKGAQVFYYKDSAQGAEFAATMQAQLKEELADGNNREAKANNNYYMLVHTTAPMVIIECGFLSNPEEAEKLVTVEYQNQLADIIVHGVQKHFETN